jgi:hypothetical protein
MIFLVKYGHFFDRSIAFVDNATLAFLCGNAPMCCLMIISSKGEVVWSTDEELDVICQTRNMSAY